MELVCGFVLLITSGRCICGGSVCLFFLFILFFFLFYFIYFFFVCVGGGGGGMCVVCVCLVMDLCTVSLTMV